MTELGDRVLGLIIIGTGLTGLFGWMIGSYGGYEGSLRYVVTAGLLVVYFLLLVGVWEALKHTSTRGG